MAIQLRPEERDPQKIVDAIIQLVQGRMNAVGVCTLDANQISTLVEFENCSSDSAVFLMPMTANAASAVATTYIPAGNVIQGAFAIVHANNAQTDRTFAFVCIGG